MNIGTNITDKQPGEKSSTGQQSTAVSQILKDKNISMKEEKILDKNDKNYIFQQKLMIYKDFMYTINLTNNCIIT